MILHGNIERCSGSAYVHPGTRQITVDLMLTERFMMMLTIRNAEAAKATADTLDATAKQIRELGTVFDS